MEGFVLLVILLVTGYILRRFLWGTAKGCFFLFVFFLFCMAALGLLLHNCAANLGH
jgi:hypothetical protein